MLDDPVPDGRPMRPDFLVIGAMKAGTTSVYQHLRAHPDVFMPTTKELHFFPADKNWTRGMAWYEAQFAGSEGSRVRGEASSSYSQADQFPGVAARVAETVPDVELVVPRPRARGADAVDVPAPARERRRSPRRRGSAPREPDLPRTRVATRRNWTSTSSTSRAEREHVCTTEQLAADPTAALQGIFRFLDVDDTWTPQPMIARGRSADRRLRSAPFRELTRTAATAAVVDRLPSGVRRIGQRVVTQPLDPEGRDDLAGARRRAPPEAPSEVDRLRSWFPDAGLEAWDAPWQAHFDP